MLFISINLLSVVFLCLLTVDIFFVLLLLHSGFVLSVLSIIHVLVLESVCFNSKYLYNVLLLTCSVSCLMLLWVHLFISIQP